METSPAIPPAENQDDKTALVTVPLAQPIIRGETKIDKITLRKPKGGELRGLTLSDLIATDIAALLKVIPRISDPFLTDKECHNLDPADLAEIGGTVRGFFMTSAEKTVMEAMIAEQMQKI